MYYKILFADHFDKYEEGLNEGLDENDFKNKNPTDWSGYVFTDKEHVMEWQVLGEYIADVEIPAGVSIRSIAHNKVASTVILSNIRLVSEMPEWNDPEFCLTAVKLEGRTLKYVKQQTDAICLAAVKQNGSALEYVKQKTPGLCLVAVQNDSFAIRFVTEQTEELCMIAVRRTPYYTMEYVRNQTDSLCRAAIMATPYSIEFVKNQTNELCMLAIELKPRTISVIKNQTAEMCLKAVRRDGMLLEHCNVRNSVIDAAAVAQNPNAAIYV